MVFYAVSGAELSNEGRFDLANWRWFEWLYPSMQELPDHVIEGLFTLVNYNDPLIRPVSPSNFSGKEIKSIEWTIPRQPDGEPKRHRLRYRELDFTNFETRFLRILPHNFSPWKQMVCCEIVHYSVVNPPRYAALSYCWGDPKNTVPILVNGAIVQVTANLEAALVSLRNNGKTLIWADALCINQNDLYERSYQVQRMGQIYSRAQKVVSWLGNSNYMLSTPSPRHAATFFQYINNSELYMAEGLARHPYWRRVWIIQEVSKSNNVEVWHPGWRCDLDQFLRYFLDGPARSYISSTGQHILRTIRYFRQREHQSHIAVARMLLSESLLRSRMSLATDPRDKLYALLSLTLDGNEVVPTPNYKQDAVSVFVEATKAMVVNQGQTALMLLAGENSVPGCSWMPFWSNGAYDIAPWIEDCILKERQTLKISTTLLKDNVMQVHGAMLDSIAQHVPRRERISPIDDRSNPEDHNHSLSVLLELWNSLTFSHDLSEFDCSYHTYRGKLPPVQKRALGFANLLLGLAPPRCKHLEAWFSKVKKFQIYGFRLGHWVECHIRNVLRLQWNGLSLRSDHHRTKKLRILTTTVPIDRDVKQLTSCLDLMERYGVKVMVLQRNRIAVVCRNAVSGDIVCRLQNCDLPVVLRKTNFTAINGLPLYTFIGEVAWPRPKDGKHAFIGYRPFQPLDLFNRSLGYSSIFSIA